jgi:hypothetical protein
MRDTNQYFSIVDSLVRHSAAVDHELSYQESKEGIGTITGILQFSDESRLNFTEVILIRSRRPIKLRYSYQYMQGDRTVFRYDNQAHHHHIKTFPHHKHIGRKVVAALEPTLKQVLEEIAALMGVE